MNRPGILALLAAAATLGVGCTDANYSVYILRNQAITDGCIIPAASSSGDTFRGFGQLDVTTPIPGTNLVNTGYLLAAAVVNGTEASADLPNARIFFAQGAEVELRSNGSAASNAILTALGTRKLTQRTQYFSGSIAPGATAGMGFPIIDAEQVAALTNFLDENPVQVIARTKIFGIIDGTTVTGGPFDYPVTVCQGCLVNNLGTCAQVTATTFNTGGTCNKLQDSLLDCCVSDAGKTTCPPPAKTTTP